MATEKEIKQSLIEQLKNKNADIDHFLSLVDDYVFLHKQEKQMQKDIRIRGRTYEYMSASGYKSEKENPSVKNAIMYNKQKLAILKELGLTTEKVIKPDDDKL